MHEGGTSTPLVVHWPAGIKARGELRHSPAHVIDIVPTILEVVGTEKPATWDGEPIPQAPGHSLVSAFDRDEIVQREFLWWLHERNRAIRVGDWKLVAANGEPWELYNLAQDPTELSDLARQHPERVSKLSSAYASWAKSHGVLSREERKPHQISPQDYRQQLEQSKQEPDP